MPLQELLINYPKAKGYVVQDSNGFREPAQYYVVYHFDAIVISVDDCLRTIVVDCTY